MLRPRVIPCLLIHDGGLVKTIAFDQPKYVGDPINAVRIFNEKEVDELIVLDIDATRDGREPDYSLIRNLAAECRMPLCYGGGVSRADQVERIVALGVEKVAMGAAVVEHPEVVANAAKCVGSQSIVAVLDTRRSGATGAYEVYVRNGTVATGTSPTVLAQQLAQAGVGEIVINSIDRDGGMAGYDLDLAIAMSRSTNLPMTMLGGAGSLAHIGALFGAVGTVGAAAGSLFVFKGSLRAVLINYPRRADRDALAANVWRRAADR